MTITDGSASNSDAQGIPVVMSAHPILDALDAIAAGQGEADTIASAQFRFVLEQLRGDALPFFAELREYKPILTTPSATLVARFRDVEEILHREAVFSVRPYLRRMTGVIGPFVLSQDLTPGYDHDISVMRLAVRREDLARVAKIVSRHADAIVDDLLRAGGPADIGRTLTRGVRVRLAAKYFGFSAEDDAQMMGGAGACSRDFFNTPRDAPATRAPAVAAGA